MKDRNSNQRRSIPRSNCQEPRIDISTIRVYYPNAHYSFDVPVESNVRAGDKMHHPAYDPAAAPAAEARTKAFDKLLRVS